MITGFEKQTHDLTNEELRMVTQLCKGFLAHVGKENAITSVKIIKKMAALGHHTKGPRLRRMVNHIRLRRKVSNLCSTNQGYFIAKTQAELDSYAKSLDERIGAIQAVRNSFGKVMAVADKDSQMTMQI